MGKRYDVPDLEARGLAVRVNDRGDKTFVVIARFAVGATPHGALLGDILPCPSSRRAMRPANGVSS